MKLDYLLPDVLPNVLVNVYPVVEWPSVHVVMLWERFLRNCAQSVAVDAAQGQAHILDAVLPCRGEVWNNRCHHNLEYLRNC